MNTITLIHDLEDLPLPDGLTLITGRLTVSAEFNRDGEMIQPFTVERIGVGSPNRDLMWATQWDRELFRTIHLTLREAPHTARINEALLDKWKEERDAGVLDPID
jgi:hypothetical protein